jgi:hypothetical protein
MTYLAEVSPRAIPFPTLGAEARRRRGDVDPGDAVKSSPDSEALGLFLLKLYVSGSDLVKLRVYPPRFCTEVTEFPAASPLARLQAETSTRVTNLEHRTVTLDDVGRFLICHLDGRHHRDELLNILAELVAKERVVVKHKGQAINDSADAQNLLVVALNEQLLLLAKNALLVA